MRRSFGSVAPWPWCARGVLLGSAVMACGVISGCGPAFNGNPQFQQPSESSWSKSFGDVMRDGGHDVAVDAFGNAVIAGGFEGEINLGGESLVTFGAEDAFVVKLDTDGNHLWSVRYGGTSSDGARAVAIDPQGNVVVAGVFSGPLNFANQVLQGNSDMFVMWLSSDGEPIVAAAFPGSGSVQVRDMVVDGLGNIIVGGTFDGDITFGGPVFVNEDAVSPSDIFVAKLSDRGGHIWSRQFRTDQSDQLRALAVDAEHNIGYTGYTSGDYVYDEYELPGSGDPQNEDVLVGVLDPDGYHRWLRRFGDEQPDRGYDVAFRPSGNLMAVGSFVETLPLDVGERTTAGGWDVFVIELDQQGVVVDGKSFGLRGNEIGFHVGVDSDGNVVLAGEYTGVASLGGEQFTADMSVPDIFVARLAPDLAHLASAGYGDEMEQEVGSMAVDKLGNVFAVGDFVGVLDFGLGPLEGQSMDSDVFLVKLGRSLL